MSINYVQCTKVVVVAVGVIGGAYCVYRIYKNSKKRVIVIPESWTYAGKLSNMYIYPVKSCAPVFMKTAECTPMGLRDGYLRDRTLMVVDNRNNFISARANPQMLLVKPEVSGTMMTLHHEDMEPWTLDLSKDSKDFTHKTHATVWGIKVPVRECKVEWFTKLLKRSDQSFRLVQYALERGRDLKPDLNYKGTKISQSTDDTGALPDELAFNLINDASVQDLNTRLDVKVSHRNFRPNLVLRGNEPYAEDNWKFLKIGSNVFEVTKPCTRCLLTTIDPETGIKNEQQEPLKTLKSFRLIEDPENRRVWGNAPQMGVQLALRSGPGTISVEDDIYYA